ncbi:MAG: translesion error-prone DNA polymerase V autoproteolytic subunit [Phycisphaerales bacterium]
MPSKSRNDIVATARAAKSRAVKTNVHLPFFGCSVSCGFPSPADDYIEKKLDLNEYLIDKPAATFFVRVSGDSMIGAGIHPDDLLIVDRSKEPKNKSIVLAIVNGDFTVKRYTSRGGKIILKAENPAHADIAIVDGMQFEVVGVCTNVIHNLK